MKQVLITEEQLYNLVDSACSKILKADETRRGTPDAAYDFLLTFHTAQVFGEISKILFKGDVTNEKTGGKKISRPED